MAEKLSKAYDKPYPQVATRPFYGTPILHQLEEEL